MADAASDALSSPFSSNELRRMLELLNGELERRSVTGEICIVGGAAMILGFGSRESTRDIDALVVAPSAIRDAAKQVAEENGFPASWLNDGAKGFASSRQVEIRELLRLSHLRVVSPPAEYILAMKCIAARVGLEAHDKEDAQFLIRHLGMKTANEVMEAVAKYYDPKQIPAKTQYFVQEACDELFA